MCTWKEGVLEFALLGDVLNKINAILIKMVTITLYSINYWETILKYLVIIVDSSTQL